MAPLTKIHHSRTFKEQERPMQHTIYCPQRSCGAPAEIVDRWMWASSDGPVEHAKTWCINGHWFTLTLDTLTTQPTPSLREPAADVMVG